MPYVYDETNWIEGGKASDALLAALDETRRVIDRNRRFVADLRRLNSAVNNELPANRAVASETALPKIYEGITAQVALLESTLANLNAKIADSVLSAQIIIGDWTPEENQ